ncbi:MAG TPA: CRTAC1 family protein [Candidatus Binatia bacterium]|nr:CRTAC1 family protein [Candidatus Binatia bacterium]
MAICPAPIKPDERLKDWWVENPWQIAAKGKSLSGYERNRIFLNARGKEFFEISGLTSGADSDGDGRAVVACDVTGDGMQDLFVRQTGGGTLLLFENRFPKTHWLEVSLRGKQSNSLGIGARVVAEIGSQKFVRELYPANSFKSQAPAHVHFGLGKNPKIDLLTITWPSGLKQEFKDVSADRHLRITEGDSEFAMLQR